MIKQNTTAIKYILSISIYVKEDLRSLLKEKIAQF